MWEGTCRHLSFADQLVAARLSGCDVMSITPATYAEHLDRGLTTAEMRLMADDEGVRLTHLDPLATWAPAWRPPDATDDMVSALGTPVDGFLDIAETLGCESITAICSFSSGAVPLDEVTEAFTRLCERARGLRVDLEFIPIWGLPDLESAWQVVKDADQTNGGLLIDFWHFYRSHSSLSLLRSIPAEKIHSVQACDAALARRRGRSEWQDLLEDRTPLGQGQFPFGELLDALAQMDALSVAGPEYFSREMVGLTPAEVARVIDETYWPQLESRGVTSARSTGRK
ncbi:sugar phosphate isomerase/epimerase family protein [Microbacterium sp. BE35]|uniref:sugar phosphate isomerase/epimerase family protein n=1 Tax=Microbacterium sp. BE35 TaxID=2817773 RepID=UPI0037CB726A